MPKDPASGIFSRMGGKTLYVFYSLRIEMNFPTLLGGEALNLFNDAKLCSVAPIEKGRNNRNAQVRPSLRFDVELEWPLIPRSKPPFSILTAVGSQCTGKWRTSVEWVENNWAGRHSDGHAPLTPGFEHVERRANRRRASDKKILRKKYTRVVFNWMELICLFNNDATERRGQET